MSYIESNLQADEKVLDRTTVHWIVYLPGLILLMVAPCVFILAYQVGSAAEDWRYFLGPPSHSCDFCRDSPCSCRDYIFDDRNRDNGSSNNLQKWAY